MPDTSTTVRFDCPIPDLEDCLRRLLDQIPPGRVTSCGILAEALGSSFAARWVGHFALHHAHRNQCPCHRIVRHDGALGPYIAGPTALKAQLLAAEGVSIEAERVNLTLHAFSAFVSDYPLQRLREEQAKVQAQVRLCRRTRMPKYVAGVDVAYPRPSEAVAAYALVETDSGKLVWSTIVRRSVAFPYISSFLSFREVPILLDLLAEVRRLGRSAEVVLVDGSGILHQRRVGVASHLGVVAGLPTIGVTKKLLYGRVKIEGMAPGESRPVWATSEEHFSGLSAPATAGKRGKKQSLLGVALRPTAGSRRPIFISPGHRVDVPFSEQLVRCLLFGRRLPAPLYWAHRLSVQGGKV